jgi:hypothetical protein
VLVIIVALCKPRELHKAAASSSSTATSRTLLLHLLLLLLLGRLRSKAQSGPSHVWAGFSAATFAPLAALVPAAALTEAGVLQGHL